jgi:hypothetical protein
MHQTTHFFNLGYGWLCKHCSAEDTERKHHHHSAQKPQGPAFARWVDQEQFRGLICTRCNISENLSHRIPG